MKYLKFLLISISIVMVFSGACDQASLQDSGVGSNNSVEQRVDEYIRTLPEEFNGTILMAVGDKIFVHKGYGLADRRFDITNTGETKYSIGSVTKTYTLILTLKLAEEGLIDLDRTVSHYLPYYPKKSGELITVRHLLAHRSGIPHHFIAIPDYFEIHDKYFHTSREYLEMFWEKKLAHPPGDKMTYTSLGYYLLGVILEEVSGQSFAELLKKYITGPLNLKATQVFNNRSVIRGMATGYKKGVNGLVLSDVEDESNRMAAGAIVSSSMDLYKFQKVLDASAQLILSDESNKLLLKYMTPGLMKKMKYIHESKTLSIYSPGFGSSFGFRAYIERMPEIDACIIVLSNVQADWVMTFDMFSELREILFDKMNIALVEDNETGAGKAVKEFIISGGQLDAYTGFYRCGDGSYMGFHRSGNRLIRIRTSRQYGYIAESHAPKELIPTGENVFCSVSDPEPEYRFLKTGENGYRLSILRNKKTVLEGSPVEQVESEFLKEYAGDYYSPETQITYRFRLENNELKVSDFPGEKEAELIPLEKNLFGFKKGFLYFHRYEDNHIRDFKLQNKDVDVLMGSVFIRK